MRFRHLTKWKSPGSCGGLLFFAQLMEEMLFDYSHATYKFSVMHTGTLCTEAIQTLNEIEKGNIKTPNINHIASELADSLERDPVAKSILILELNSFLPILKNPKSLPSEIRTIVELLSIQLHPKIYLVKNEELLIYEIENSQDQNVIRRLTRIYVTSLVALSFHTKYLYELVLDFFFHGPDSIDTPSSIREFIALLKAEKKDYLVIFRVENIFHEAKSSCEQMGWSIADVLPADIVVPSSKYFPLRKNEVFAICPKVEAQDFYSARDKFEKRLKMLSTLLNLYHHKLNPVWSSNCIVQLSSTKELKRIACSTNPMHKCADLKTPIASKKLKLFLDDFSLEQASFNKFLRSAQLHSLALRSDSPENQILNLWISLESLIPYESKDPDSSNIEHIINSLMPFLNIQYIDELIITLLRDLLRWDSTLTRKTLKKIDGKSLSERLLHLLVLPANHIKLKVIEDQLTQFPLLKTRIDYFKDLLASPQKVLGALKAHQQRLEWQLRRIYRVRNIIVHSGTTPTYTTLIIPNAHDYLDTVLNSLTKLASAPRLIKSVSQGFKYSELAYKSYSKNLQEKGLIFTKDNLTHLLLSQLI